MGSWLASVQPQEAEHGLEGKGWLGGTGGPGVGWQVQLLLDNSPGSQLPSLAVSLCSFSAPDHGQSLSREVWFRSVMGRLTGPLMEARHGLTGPRGEGPWPGRAGNPAGTPASSPGGARSQ